MTWTFLLKGTPKLPDVPEEQRTPLVTMLLEITQLQKEQIQALKDEIARLKGLKPRPKIRPSRLEDSSRAKAKDKGGKKRKKGKRAGSAKRSKTRELKIHETVKIRPEGIPQGSRLKGYEDYTVQEIIFCAHNTRYLLERWQTPTGDCVVGKVPAQVARGHFGPMLISFILYQYYHSLVTQPLILEQLREIGIEISAGKINAIIIEGKDRFHWEKDEILRVGLEVSTYIHVDDTGARHQGRGGYCTHIGNELFAWFESTKSKSRINFLELLRAGRSDYVVSDEALRYMEGQKLPASPLGQLAALGERSFPDKAHWSACLEALGIINERHIRIATEGALLGSAIEHGVEPDLVIMSDDAGQFAVLLHALCWIHAERTIKKLVGFCQTHREALEEIRTQIWDFYDDLKAYKTTPSEKGKAELEARFDEIFTTKTCYISLNLALERLHKKRAALLLGLEHPQIPLQNNLSERDIREYVKRRKISGSTRSDRGRRCRDTFTSLKKTCRKLGIPFWDYLQDRVLGLDRIPPLGDMIRQGARASPACRTCL